MSQISNSFQSIPASLGGLIKAEVSRKVEVYADLLGVSANSFEQLSMALEATHAESASRLMENFIVEVSDEVNLRLKGLWDCHVNLFMVRNHIRYTVSKERNLSMAPPTEDDSLPPLDGKNRNELQERVDDFVREIDIAILLKLNDKEVEKIFDKHMTGLDSSSRKVLLTAVTDRIRKR